MIKFIELDKQANQYIFQHAEYGVIRVGKKTTDNPNGAGNQSEAASIALHCFDVVEETGE